MVGDRGVCLPAKEQKVMELRGHPSARTPKPCPLIYVDECVKRIGGLRFKHDVNAINLFSKRLTEDPIWMRNLAGPARLKDREKKGLLVVDTFPHLLTDNSHR